jgi:hypothetical protein
MLTINDIDIKHVLGDVKWLKENIKIVSFLCHAINRKFLNPLLSYDTFFACGINFYENVHHSQNKCYNCKMTKEKGMASCLGEI